MALTNGVTFWFGNRTGNTTLLPSYPTALHYLDTTTTLITGISVNDQHYGNCYGPDVQTFILPPLDNGFFYLQEFQTLYSYLHDSSDNAIAGLSYLQGQVGSTVFKVGKKNDPQTQKNNISLQANLKVKIIGLSVRSAENQDIIGALQFEVAF